MTYKADMNSLAEDFLSEYRTALPAFDYTDGELAELAIDWDGYPEECDRGALVHAFARLRESIERAAFYTPSTLAPRRVQTPNMRERRE